MSSMDKVLKAIEEEKKAGIKPKKRKSDFNKSKFEKILKRTFKPKNM